MTTTYVCRSHSRLVQVGEGPDPETFLVENLRTKTGKLIKIGLLFQVVVANGGDVKCRRKKEAHIFSSQYNRTNSQNFCVLCFAPLLCFFLFLFLSCFLPTPSDTAEIYCNSGPSILEVAREPHHRVTIISSILVRVRIPNNEDFPPTSYVEQTLSSGFAKCKNV